MKIFPWKKSSSDPLPPHLGEHGRPRVVVENLSPIDIFYRRSISGRHTAKTDRNSTSPIPAIGAPLENKIDGLQYDVIDHLAGRFQSNLQKFPRQNLAHHPSRKRQNDPDYISDAVIKMKRSKGTCVVMGVIGGPLYDAVYGHGYSLYTVRTFLQTSLGIMTTESDRAGTRPYDSTFGVKQLCWLRYGSRGYYVRD